MVDQNIETAVTGAPPRRALCARDFDTSGLTAKGLSAIVGNGRDGNLSVTSFWRRSLRLYGCALTDQ